MKNEINENNEKILKDEERREFLDKFGKLTVTVPAAMLLLMGPHQSVAAASSGADTGHFG